jgi:hypothetical protein
MELPPESELTEPINVSNSPFEPVRAMPYIGLWGLLPVSFSERAAMMVPLVAAAVPAAARIFMPRRNAESVWNARPKVESVKVGRLGVMLPGSPSLE